MKTRAMLGDVADYFNGRAFKPEEWADKGLPIIRIQNLTGSTNITNYFDGEFDKKHFVTNGDLLISWSASLGVYIWSGNDAVLNQHIFKVVPKNGVDKVYLYFAATHALDEMKSKVHGATMQHITKEPFESTLIPLPDLETQRRIASMLSKADRLRRLRRYALEISDSYLQGVFLEVFGDPETNPFGFDFVTVEDLASKVTDGEHATPKRTSTGIKLLSARNVKNGFIDFEAGLDFIPQSEYDRISRRCKPEFGDILISCSGTIGRVTTVNIHEPFSLVRSVALIKPLDDRVVPQYLEHFLRTRYGQRQMELGANQSSQANLFIEPVKSLPVLLPPLELQQHFAQIVRKHGRLRVQQMEALRQAEHLYQTLLHQAFTVEV